MVTEIFQSANWVLLGSIDIKCKCMFERHRRKDDECDEHCGCSCMYVKKKQVS